MRQACRIEIPGLAYRPKFLQSSRKAYYVKLSYAYFMRGGRMSRKSVMRGLQAAVGHGYLLRRRVGKQQWEYAIPWKE